MSKKPTTHVLLVTDMSGSMYPLGADVRGGYNAYLDGLARDGDVRYRITSALFNEQYHLLCAAAKLKDAPRLDESSYRPGGATALLDAIGKTIADFETRVPTLGEADRVLLVVQTDGQENASCEHHTADIRQMIADREAGGRWSCIYLGAGPAAWRQSRNLGFAAGQSVNLPHSSQATRSTYTVLTDATSRYSRGASGADTTRSIADATGGEQR
ncbi:VWA domain-containing protein [Micromonospora sp. C51]|uniref:vWA domain-containing protein n=1 Tax=Micromonospora sp. C51 TaxID=2824879 RepID=UPI001B38DE07|nr:vWA domain-containing protein [Micromonospora sp. C51]MBQ1047786.1 VWA domain-containing protein [Micromonospora sp. C51]